MRRRAGHLLDLEAQILGALVGGTDSDAEVHGFALAKELADRQGSRRLTSHGTLYKALARLEDAGAVTSRWEDSAIAERDGRPRRRLYRVTGTGRAALRAHLEAGERDAVARPRRLGIQTP
ncbi:MAG: PadR family transcriptional regulator [Leifsonia sp.]